MNNLRKMLNSVTCSLALVAICLTLLVSPALADYIIAQENGPETSGGWATVGQSFTTIGTGQITQIDFYAGDMAENTTNLRIYSGGQQPNNPAAALYVQPYIYVDCNDCWFSIPLTTPLNVSAATLYTFELTDVNWKYSASNPYSGGTAWQSGSSASTYDLAFRVHVREAGLALTKKVSPSSAKPGEAITYTIAFSNTGTITATNVVITDTLSAHITNPSWSSSGVALTQVPGSRYVWSAPDLLQNDGGVITITGVLAKPLAAGTIPNTVTLAVSGTVKTANAGLTVENVAPVAAAGADQQVSIDKVVTLNGGGADDNGDTLTYGWAQTGGAPTVTLSSATAQQPTFTAPGAETVLTFTLTVTDTGALTDTDEVVVRVVENYIYYFPLVFRNGAP